MPSQLTSAVQPLHYQLHHSIDFAASTFSGTVVIEITITDPQDMLRLHCKGLTITTCTLTYSDHDLPVSFIISDGELHIQSNKLFNTGNYLLHLDFFGTLSDNLSGLYRSKYIDASGSTAYLATTQFEAPYAREAFPCFDEPRFKATFTVSMDIPTEMTAISNMPVISEVINGNRKTVLFTITPLMSTYLLYLGAGMFDYIEEIRNDRIIRVYGVNGKSRQGAFALTFAADSLEFFEHYSGIPYPLPKLDLIAIPDFAAGAMENWGAITFREVLLYVDDKDTSLPTKKRVAEVIAHELWHQWSGNLVTMQWWDDLWLNEAFATYIAYRAVNHFYPEWCIWDKFLAIETKYAFELDMLSSTHPIAIKVDTPNEIEETFDSISYGKGGCVLHMIEQYIGEESFKKGVNAYLEKFSYRNAVARDLWDTLETYSGKPVKDILVSWITTPGFPLVSVTEHENSVMLRQQRFSTDTTSSSSIWPIPLTWTDGEHNSVHLLETSQCSIDTPSAEIKFNTRQSGFYRTLYTPQRYDRFHEVIRKKQYQVHDRYGILDDLWACTLAGKVPLSVLLNFMNSYINEDHQIILEAITAICHKITLTLQLPENGKAFFSRYKTPFFTQFKRLGWTPSVSDTPEEIELRTSSIGFLVTAGEPEVFSEACMRAEAYLNGMFLSPDIRFVCLKALSLSADPVQFETIKKAYEATSRTEEKIDLLSVLARFVDERLLEAYLDYVVSDAVRRQDLSIVFSQIINNRVCSKIFFPWVQHNWHRLSSLSDSYHVFIGLLQAIILSAPDMMTLDSIRTFLSEHTKEFEKTKANAFEKAEVYLRFREREKTSVMVFPE